jgi:hypothetical protein
MEEVDLPPPPPKKKDRKVKPSKIEDKPKR